MKLYHTIGKNLQHFQQMIQKIESNQTPLLSVGLSDLHKAHLLYTAAHQLEKPLLLVTADETVARKLCDDLNAMHQKEQPIATLYPAKEFVFRQTAGVSRELEHQRLGVLVGLSRRECPICVCTVDALMQRTIPPEQLKQHTFSISQDGDCTRDALVKQLIQAGYSHRPQVEAVAQFSVRGGIVDIYSPGSMTPVRIEFFGDEIDSIQLFNVQTQRRIEGLSQVLILPAKECLFDRDTSMIQQLKAFQQRLGGDQAPAFLQQDLRALDQQEEEWFCWDKYLPLAYKKTSTLLDYLDDGVVFLSEYHAIKQRGQAYEWQIQQDLMTLFDEGVLCKELEEYTIPYSVLLSQQAEKTVVVLDTFSHTHRDLHYKELFTLHPIITSNFSGELNILQEDLSPLLEDNYCIVILAGTQKAAKNLAEDLHHRGLPAEYSSDMTRMHFGHITVLEGRLSGGFEYPDMKFSLFSTGRTEHYTKRRQGVFQKGKHLRALDDLVAGDYVVHISHGIGIFDGIKQISLHGVIKDYIKIRYAGADILYVPVTQLDLVSKYIGSKEDDRVKLNKLNSGEWQKTKNRVKTACAEMAEELIALYAKRMEEKGYAFPADTDWQQAFEAHFDYEETDDQLRCADEIKTDMEKHHPMDRLLCGDVGFGKTEIAFRAAFKCMMANKQCVLLCPTTILAWQHYQNAIKRFEQYPIRIELMSRFRSQKEIKKTIQQLQTGEIDFLIGTHRVVQKDIVFKNLGLAMIDEEQRFGVGHKERFKEMFAGVDMLTISATPIPRTLNMAVNGIRDISTIEQPPQDRHPVQTYVIEHDWGILVTAIQKELRRGGQVYYIHNRVESIDQCAGKLKQLLPNSRIGVAHGKMGEVQLSNIWRQLMEQEIDILVCTTIIETGVDVKNCNTLIIEQADYLGLSQLYQLRGRVGRSNRRAFAYFTFRQGKVLTEVATKRLSAIRDFTTFGSGFRIAMRDLEIRGAGSLLGERQHGHMEAVGYDMYVRLLQEAVAKRRGEPIKQRSHECLIDVQLNAHIPEIYIHNISHRLEMYKKISLISTQEQRMDLLDEMIDRFGDPPPSVITLLEVGLLRNILADHGFYEINQRGTLLLFYMQEFRLEVAQILVKGLGNRISIHASHKPFVGVALTSTNTVIDTLRQTVKILSETPPAPTIEADQTRPKN